jgi:Fic family protein
MTPPGDPHRSLLPSEGARHPFRWDDAELAALLGALDERVQRARARVLPEATLKSLRLWFRTQHVYHSNAIEGSTLTLHETQVVIGDGLTVGGKPLRDVLAAKNLADALDWVEGLARERAIDERTIRELHAVILRGEAENIPGNYKREDNRVAGANFRTPSFLQTPPLMEALARFLVEPGAVHPVVESAIAHAWLVGVHPFRDGNGRTGRLLGNLVLMQRGYPIALLTEDLRPAYYSSLDHAHCTGDLGAFIRLWINCVERVLGEYEKLSGDLEVRENDVKYITELIRTSQSTQERSYREWNDALEVLAAELAEYAQRLTAQRGDASSARFTAARIPFSPAHLAQARSGAVPVLQLEGQLAPVPFSAEVRLARFDSSVDPGGVRLELPWPNRPQRKELAGLHLRPKGWLLSWRGPGGGVEASEVTATAAANALWKEAIERTAGIPAELTRPT